MCCNHVLHICGINVGQKSLNGVVQSSQDAVQSIGGCLVLLGPQLLEPFRQTEKPINHKRDVIVDRSLEVKIVSHLLVTG